MSVTLAKLSKHGKRIQSAGYLPANMPAVFSIRRAVDGDRVAASAPFVTDDYDGNGLVALKREDFDLLIPADADTL